MVGAAPIAVRPWVVRAALLGPCLRQESGELADLLSEDFATFDETQDFPGTASDHPAVRFLLFGACLLPALLAPSTDAPRVLGTLKFGGGLESLHALQGAVAEWGKSQMRLDPSSLRQVRDQAAWQSKVDALHQECTEWFNGLNSRKVKFADATLVLKGAPGGVPGRDYPAPRNRSNPYPREIESSQFIHGQSRDGTRAPGVGVW